MNHHFSRADVLGLSSLGASVTLSQVSTFVSIIAGLTCFAVYALQLWDRYKGNR
jgi:hypothetical protein